MAAPSNIVGIARQQTIFAVKETTKGTQAFPALAAPLIIGAGSLGMNQNPGFSDSEAVRNSRDVLGQFQDMTPAGSWTLPIYARPSGALGVAPMADVIFESLFGLKTVNAGTSVVYSPALTKPSLSLFALCGHTVFFGLGAVAETLKVTATNKGGVKFTVGGSFMQLGWSGRDAVKTAATLGASVVTVYDAAKFTVGATVQNVTKADKATNGYTVTAADTVADTITVSPVLAMAWAIDDVVQGYLPAGTAPTGSDLESRKTSILIGGSSQTLQSLDMSYDDKVKMLDDEISTTGYPQDYLENNRKTSGTAKMYFRQNDLQKFVDGLAGNEQTISMTFGTVAGSKLVVAMPRNKIQVPKRSFSAPAVELSVDFTTLGTNGEDSVSFTWQ